MKIPTSRLRRENGVWMPPEGAEHKRATCKNCGVAIERIECADGYDRWMHILTASYNALFLECVRPKTVAQPDTP